MRKGQSGIMLLEALIAILIFSLGVLGIVGLQASAVAASRDAKYRTDAGLLANELIGQMWSGNRDGEALRDNFQGDADDALPASVVVDGPLFLLWRARVRATLPGAELNDPEVTITPGLVGPPRTSSTVSVTVKWKSPSDAAFHNYVAIVQII